ncbi:MAG: phosphatase PAP2 family protein [Actinomycetota bacterium]|nr:phosphatase PAP2 family protein [Actinomycetota bacterium]
MTPFVELIFKLDRTIFESLNSIAGKSSVLDFIIRLGSDDHIIPVLLALLALFTIFIAENSKPRKEAVTCLLCALFSVLISMAIVFFLNSLFFRPRPFTSHSVNLIFYCNTDSSFPSNATTLAFSLSFPFLFHNRRIGIVMLGLSAYSGLARIISGVHYPLDILSGILIGFSCCILSKNLEFAYRPVSNGINRWILRLMGSWHSS